MGCGVSESLCAGVWLGYFSWLGFFCWLGFSLPHLEHPQAVGDVGEGSGALWGGVFGAERPFPEKDLAFQQLGFVLIKLICAFCLPLLLCVSLYIL